MIYQPGYIKCRTPEDWPPMQPPAQPAEPAEPPAAMDDMEDQEVTGERDHSEYLSCYSCGSFVDDYLFGFCTECG